MEHTHNQRPLGSWLVLEIVIVQYMHSWLRFADHVGGIASWARHWQITSGFQSCSVVIRQAECAVCAMAVVTEQCSILQSFNFLQLVLQWHELRLPLPVHCESYSTECGL